jgi:hypothetical protein
VIQDFEASALLTYFQGERLTPEGTRPNPTTPDKEKPNQSVNV